jgi:excinuclease ABC subunit C
MVIGRLKTITGKEKYRATAGPVRYFEDDNMPLSERLHKVPLKPGVYIFKDQDGRVIYIGKARILRNRMRSYFHAPKGLLPKVRAMMNRVADFDYIVTRSEVEALILENNLIKAYQPRYNILLRDDKSYPYLKLTVEKYPRLCIVREKKDGVSRYYGPYTEAGSLRETLRLLMTIFPLRSCKTLRFNHRPCLNYDLGRCLAPCSGKVDENEYGHMVEDLAGFLEGRVEGLLADKEKEMRKAAADLDFEKAARLRDQIQAIKVRGEAKCSFAYPYNLDLAGMISGDKDNLVLVFKLREGRIVAKDTFWLKKAIDEREDEVLGFFLKHYYSEQQDIPPEILVNILPCDGGLLETWLGEKNGRRMVIKVPGRGEKKQLLDMLLENARLLWEERLREDFLARRALSSLAESLRLEVLPERIECYDISHLSGEETVASMVVFSGGNPDKKHYRRFKIKNEQNNDLASLSETLRRRIMQARQGNEAFLPEPDLIIIDGGLGQVNAVQTVLNDLEVNIPVFSLAKKNEEIYSPGSAQPLVLARRDEGLRLLQRMRDEAHRFAVDYNRQRRGKKLSRSALDDIGGVGTKRKTALLNHFGSVARIQAAGLDDLLQVPGMNRPAAENVYKYFHHDE